MLKIVYNKTITRRPAILVKAASICAKKYKRELMLPRLLGASTNRVVEMLQIKEAGLEELRRAKEGTYSAQVHVETLSALLAETKEAA